jgi:AcrR family transcriptional regulator
MMKKNTTRHLILEAVIACIEKYGVDKVTTRKIAQEAGTNIASINYYFSSKDDLINEALSMALQHMYEDVMMIIEDRQKSFQEVLRELLTYLLLGAQRYPGMVMAHIYPTVVEKQTGTPGEIVFSKIFAILLERASQDFPKKPSADLRASLDQCMTSMMFHMIAPYFFNRNEKIANNQLIENAVTYFYKSLVDSIPL